MTPEELEEIEKIVKKHSGGGSDATLICILFLMFIGGCFKGCGY